MDRLDFIDLLDDIKIQNNTTTSDLSYFMKVPWGSVRRLEEGKTNSGVDTILKYIAYFNSHIKLTAWLANKEYHIMKYDDLLVWMKETRNHKFTKFTQRTLAKEIGRSYVNIANIETKKSIMSIDTFLKLTDSLATKVEIIENEQNT